jgi:hypothetical protein
MKKEVYDRIPDAFLESQEWRFEILEEMKSTAG